MTDLFSEQVPSIQVIAPGITLLKQFADSSELLPLILLIQQQSPFRHMSTTMGHNMRVTTTNCGELGGHSDANGYRYLKTDPLTSKPWPNMPDVFKALAIRASEAAGILGFNPDSCLINHYPIGISMGSHQDKGEIDFNWPIISVSIGLTAIFQVFGATRSGVELEIKQDDGDVLVIGGPARLFYHGVKPIKPDLLQPNLTERINLTLRKAR
jgi:alkylated DNA repair protein (DNA oxidative demethylase)